MKREKEFHIKLFPFSDVTFFPLKLGNEYNVYVEKVVYKYLSTTDKFCYDYSEKVRQ